MVVFTFSVLDWEYPFWTNWVQNIKIVSLKWNLGPRLISNMQNLIVMFTFPFFDRK